MGGEGTNWSDWEQGGFRGPPPWRRGFRPMYLLTSLAVFAGLLILIWLFVSGRLP
jgi:uncharacterized protein involved in response to NO